MTEMEEFDAKESLHVVFDELEDPRIDRTKKYPLHEVLFLSLCAVLSDMDGWRSIEMYGQIKIDLLRKYFPYQNGIPSFKTIARVFSLIPPASFEALFMAFMRWLTQSDQEIIAIDGKTVRRSYDKGKGSLPIHILNVWAVNRGLCLGQAQVAAETNEITVVPQILDHIDVRGATVTVDAMNAQKTIAEKIVKKGGEYVMAIKDNHINLKFALERFFNRNNLTEQPTYSVHETIEKGHGRIETRRYTCVKNTTRIPDQESWIGLQTLCKVESETIRDGALHKSIRYYISSLAPDAKTIGEKIRSHWGIENSLHWVLDVTFGEDQSRKRKDHAPRNFSLLRKIALNIVKMDKESKASLVLRRRRISMDEQYFVSALSNVGFSQVI